MQSKPSLRYRTSRAVACPGGGECREFAREVLMQSVHPEVRHKAAHFTAFMFGGTVFMPIVDGKALDLPGLTREPAPKPPSSQTLRPPVNAVSSSSLRTSPPTITTTSRRNALLLGATIGAIVLALVGVASLAASRVSTVASPLCDKRVEVCGR